MSAQKSMILPEDIFINESEVPSFFDELDPMEEADCKLRTLVDFEVMDEQGRRVNFNDLQRCKEKGLSLVVRGYVVEPLELNLRRAIENFASSAESSTVAAPSESLGHNLPVEVEPQSIAESAPVPQLDRSNLKPGTNIDGYCNKTYQWFAAKIVGVRENEVKVHFQGWNVKHDEWIDCYSDRIAAFGSSTKLVFDAIRRAEDMVPWYETRRLYAKAQRKIGDKSKSPHPYPQSKLDPKLRRQAVIIRGISDWCIDLSYCSPSLWLIADSNIWYRVAGLFVPGGHLGFPSEGYASVFDSFVAQFEACAHVAMVLQDFYGQNPKLMVQEVAAEICARTNKRVGEHILLYSASLISEQIKNMPLSPDWDLTRCKPYKDSPFMQQLLKYSKAATIAANKLSTSTQGNTGGRRLPGDKNANTPLETSQESLWKLLQRGRNVRQKNTIYNALIKHSALKYPMVDSDYWDVEFFRGRLPAPLPRPLESPKLGCPDHLIDATLQTWCLLMNFRGSESLGNLPYVSLDRFISMIRLDSTSNVTVEAQLHPVDPLLRHVICRLLAHGCTKGCWDTLSMQSNGIMACTNMSIFEALPIVSGASHFMHRRPVMLMGGGAETFLQRLPPPPRGHKFTSDDRHAMFLDALKLVQQGDAWVEVLRMVLAKQEKIPLPEYEDPIGDALYAIWDLSNEPNAAAFLEAVDPVRDGVPDYLSIVKAPIHLMEIENRIVQGWYDTPVSVGATGSGIRKGRSREDGHNMKHDTRGRGVAGILEDVQRLWDNCRLYWKNQPMPEGSDEHPIVVAAFELEIKFSMFLVNRGVTRLDGLTEGVTVKAEQVIDAAAAPHSLKSETELEKFYGISKRERGALFNYLGKNNWETVVSTLGSCAQPACIPSEVLLQSLRWLLLEFSRSDEGHAHITLVQSSDAAAADGVVGDAGVGAKPAKGPKGAKKGRKKVKDNDGEPKEAGGEASGAPDAPEEEEDQTSPTANTRVIRDNKRYAVDADGNVKYACIEPIGYDRHGQRYWHFCFAGVSPTLGSLSPLSALPDQSLTITSNSLDAKNPEQDSSTTRIEEFALDRSRIFCEDMITGTWLIYSAQNDIRALMAWLDVRGRDEANLLKELRNRLDLPKAPLPSSGNAPSVETSVEGIQSAIDEQTVIGDTSGKRKRVQGSDTDTDEDAFISSSDLKPHKVCSNTKMTPLAPTSTTPTSTTVDAKFISYWQPYELTSILYDCRVHYVDSLGMGVKETVEVTKGRNVVVVSLAKLEGQLSAAEAAGLCVGDRLITCNGVPTVSIKIVQSVIKASKEQNSNTPIVLDVVVARSTNQLGRIDPQYCDESIRRIADSYTHESCKLQEDPAFPGRTAGLLLDLLHRYIATAAGKEDFASCHASALTALVTPNLRNSSRGKNRRAGEDEWQCENDVWEAGAPPLFQLRSTLLALEAHLAIATKNNKARKNERELRPVWLGDDRMRYRWRRLVAEARSYSMISACAVVLGLAMNCPPLP